MSELGRANVLKSDVCYPSKQLSWLTRSCRKSLPEYRIQVVSFHVVKISALEIIRNFVIDSCWTKRVEQLSFYENTTKDIQHKCSKSLSLSFSRALRERQRFTCLLL